MNNNKIYNTLYCKFMQQTGSHKMLIFLPNACICSICCITLLCLDNQQNNKPSPSSVAFANFYSVNALTIANFKLPT